MTRTDRAARLRAIETIVKARRVSTQETLGRILAERGFDVSQSTLSRDIRELGLVKRPGREGGSSYALPDAGPGRASGALERLLPELLEGVEQTGSLLVVRTLPGSAHPVAGAVDRAGWAEVAGTVAGDDTLLVIARSARGARALAGRLLSLAGRA